MPRPIRVVLRFYPYELYTSLDAFKDHLCTAHVRQFIARAASCSVCLGTDVLVQLTRLACTEEVASAATPPALAAMR